MHSSEPILTSVNIYIYITSTVQCTVSILMFDFTITRTVCTVQYSTWYLWSNAHSTHAIQLSNTQSTATRGQQTGSNSPDPEANCHLDFTKYTTEEKPVQEILEHVRSRLSSMLPHPVFPSTSLRIREMTERPKQYDSATNNDSNSSQT